MKAQDAIRTTLETSTMVIKGYIGDLTDEELLKRPGPECNHIAWQLGHLISSECMLLESVKPGAAVELPEGFAESHSKENAGVDDPSKFCTKQEYLDLIEKVQGATIAALSEVTEEELDAEAPEKFRQMFPTAGHVYVLIATHFMMHAGQFVPVRRALGKPIVM